LTFSWEPETLQPVVAGVPRATPVVIVLCGVNETSVIVALLAVATVNEKTTDEPWSSVPVNVSVTTGPGVAAAVGDVLLLHADTRSRTDTHAKTVETLDMALPFDAGSRRARPPQTPTATSSIGAASPARRCKKRVNALGGACRMRRREDQWPIRRAEASHSNLVGGVGMVVKGGSMKVLAGVGLLLLILGVVSLFVPIPQRERHGLRAGDVSFGITTQHDEKVSPVVSAALILGGVGMLIAARVRRT
jgi:hypothetical protein